MQIGVSPSLLIAVGRVLRLRVGYRRSQNRPLGDSRYGKLRAEKLPFMRDGARFALRLAEMSLSRLGEGRRTPAYRRPQNLPKCLPVSSRNRVTQEFD